MVLEKSNFIIEYDERLKYIPDIVNYLESKMNDIMIFFELCSFDSKTKIVIYNELESYKKHIEQFFEYHDYMCADTNDGNINLLSLEAAHQTKEHSAMTLDELKKVVLHEFVHICQQEKEIEHIDDDTVWFWEGLATNIGNPDNYEVINILAANEDINNFNCSANNYPIAYTIGNYMLKNYSQEQILEYIKFPSKLLNDSEQILNDAREWSNQKNKTI